MRRRKVLVVLAELAVLGAVVRGTRAYALWSRLSQAVRITRKNFYRVREAITLVVAVILGPPETTEL
jgi:hypothetical protein